MPETMRRYRITTADDLLYKIDPAEPRSIALDCLLRKQFRGIVFQAQNLAKAGAVGKDSKRPAQIKCNHYTETAATDLACMEERKGILELHGQQRRDLYELMNLDKKLHGPVETIKAKSSKAGLEMFTR